MPDSLVHYKYKSSNEQHTISFDGPHISVIELKQLARKANIEKVDVGPKGMSLAFRNNEFSKPDQLVAWIAGKQGRVQLRADHKLVLQQPMAKVDERPAVCKQIVQELLALAV